MKNNIFFALLNIAAGIAFFGAIPTITGMCFYDAIPQDEFLLFAIMVGYTLAILITFLILSKLEECHARRNR